MAEARNRPENGKQTSVGGKRLLRWAAVLSIAALLAHAIDAPGHLTEWWGYSSFFVTAAAFQFFYGFGLLLQPWRYDDTGGVRADAERLGRPYYILGIVIIALIIAVYAVSRTSGLPFLGPEAAAEPVTLLSLVPIAEDLPLLYCLVSLARRTRAHSPRAVRVVKA